MIDEWKEVKIIAGLVIGLGVVAFGVYTVVLHGSYLAWLAVLLMTVLAVALIGRLAASVYWAFKGPRALYDSEQKRLAALTDHQGQTMLLPHAPYPANLQSLHYQHAAPLAEPASTPALALPPATVTEEKPTLPTAKAIYEIVPTLHQAEKVLLGYDEHGPIWLDIEELLSIALAGNSGRGKSRALLWLVVQFLRLKLETRILDGKADLCKWVGLYHPVAYTAEEINWMVEEITEEITRRLEEDSRTPNHAPFPPMLVVLDELDLLQSRSAGVTELVELLTKKTRSIGVHGIYSNQSIPADLVGGVQTRGVIVSRICFYCDDEAARLIGVRKDNGGQALLQRIGPPAPQGLALVRTAVFGWKILAFPFVPDEALPYLLGIHALPPLPMKPGVSLPETAPETRPKSLLSAREKERKTILDWHSQGLPAYAIARKLGKAAAYAEEIKRIIAEERSHEEADN